MNEAASNLVVDRTVANLELLNLAETASAIVIVIVKAIHFYIQID